MTEGVTWEQGVVGCFLESDWLRLDLDHVPPKGRAEGKPACCNLAAKTQAQAEPVPGQLTVP